MGQLWGVWIKMNTETFLPLLFLGFLLLIVSRLIAIKLAKSSLPNGRHSELALLDYIPLNTPSEALKSLSAFGKAALSKPLSLVGLLSFIHIATWISLIGAVIFEIFR